MLKHDTRTHTHEIHSGVRWRLQATQLLLLPEFISLSSLCSFRCLASHPRPFRVEVMLSGRLMVSPCHCHSHPLLSTLNPLLLTLPSCFIPLWEMSLSIWQQLFAPPLHGCPACVWFPYTSLQCEHEHRCLTAFNLPKDRFH